MNEFESTDGEERDELNAKAKREERRLRKLFAGVFGTKEGKEALQIIGDYFEVDMPSAPASGFDAGKSFYMDGHKAVIKFINDIQTGKYNEK